MSKMFSLTVHSTNKAGKRTALGHKIEAASKEEAAVKAIAHHAKIGHKNILVTHHDLKEDVQNDSFEFLGESTIGTNGSVSIKVVKGKDKVTKKETRHVEMHSPGQKKVRLITSVNPKHEHSDIINHLKNTHGKKLDGFKWMSEEVEQLDESWIHVKSHEDFVKHVKANHPDAKHVHHDNKISQAVVGPRKNPVGHWDDELGVGRVKKSHLSEEQLDEAPRFDHRTAGSHGVIHSDSAKHYKVGEHMDFYDHGTGDKKYGKVTVNDGKNIHIRHDGKVKKFKVGINYPGLHEESVADKATREKWTAQDFRAHYAKTQKPKSEQEKEHERWERKYTHNKVNEEEQIDEDEMQIVEEFSSKEAADKALEKHNAKHPTAKHSVIQGRRSGKWHVVRHTSGGMHIVEADEHGFPDDRDHIASLTSDPPVERISELHKDHQKKIRAFVKSKHWKEVDKKHTDPHTGEKHAGGHVDDDFHKAFKKWHKETHGTVHKPFKPLHEGVEITEEGEWKSWLSTEYPGQTKFEPKYAVDPLKSSKVATVKELVKGKKS